MSAIRAITLLILSAGQAMAQSTLPVDFVHLRAVDPSIAQDIRYAGSDNFTGRPLAGYEAAECILRREVALALARVQADLSGQGLGLKVYDCYRPERAVRMMSQWANDGRAGDTRFHPRVEKRNLLNGYISQQSLHATGIAVDLTLVEKGAPPAPAGVAHDAPCNAAGRDHDGSVDMGTSYDCLDPDSHTGSPAATSAQRRWRMTLVAAMEKRGFKNYHREWWHFSYPAAGTGGYWDFPIRLPRP